VKIEYVHSADPGAVKIYDTEKSLKGCAGLLNMMGLAPTQEEWDKQELSAFERDMKRGLVLQYNIVERKGAEV